MPTIFKPILIWLLDQRELLVSGIYWLAELEPFDFALFAILYVAGLIGFLAMCYLAS